ncbi:MAG TPA: BadF/BadG/BcrA/BcrD ATPase family protein [Candidatus Acidoferrales bacterium]|nr:BadF/BadG/BcrA/BcrD ATPase family protein [Candidatus Acidoferrales bacterium]
MSGNFVVGVDVGSTTVKVVANIANGERTVFSRYVRHEGRQAETLLALLRDLEAETGVRRENTRVFITGSGGSSLAGLIGAKFVQEVTAVSIAVERFYPKVNSVIELGGQDSKIIVFQPTNRADQRKKIATMNDRCAGGTGAVIEKIAAKLNIPLSDLPKLEFDGVPKHAVAGKCGVFAETDITGLQKRGVAPRELMASLFEAIVLQNLTVLTRGNTLKPQVLLLGGPHFFLPGMRQAWRHHLLRMWNQQGIALPDGVPRDELILTPTDAQFFGALGAIEFGRGEEERVGQYLGTKALAAHLQVNAEGNSLGGVPGLCAGPADLQEFLATYASAPATRARAVSAEVDVFIGIDGGSTSTKAVVLAPDGEVLESAYRLSLADPITDALAVLRELRDRFAQSGTRLNVLGVATTGYSKDLLQRVLGADLALVETVAHAKSALQLRPDVDAIIDVGGQDIKIIALQDGAVKDFRLNTQCSAGNGYFLQSAAELLGIPINEFADVAFRAQRMPVFSYGCAVFLQSDIVNFQRQGWRPEEIIAGLAAVLPKNVFLYVAGVSNIARLGKRFLLQGGTQRNKAVVKAEVDFIHSHYFADGRPEIIIHPNCGEAGAIGAALEAIRLHSPQRRTRFIGLDALDNIQYTIKHDESTRCGFCTNRCLRTFIDMEAAQKVRTAIAASSGTSHRVIVANCERGQAEDNSAARKFNLALKSVRDSNPCIPSLADIELWQAPEGQGTAPSKQRFWALRAADKQAKRSSVHIGIPRVLNLYAYAPLFTAYLVSLGVPQQHIVFSSRTTPELYKRAVGLAAIDPCFPSKVCVSHIYDLLEMSRAKHRLDYIFFPMVDTVLSTLENCAGANACPSGVATPEAVKAAFSSSRDWFREAGIEFLNPLLDIANTSMFRMQMFECWHEILGVSWRENNRAIEKALQSQSEFEARMRQRSQATLDMLEREGRVGLVLLGRPYHHDVGLNQGILDKFQELGYPVLSQQYLPSDPELLERLFGEEVRAGIIRSPLDISDVWKNSTSANTNLKLWAAKFTARHPNLIPVELSNFKCGHDAFVSNVIEQISHCAGKPHFCFRDLDENKPHGSLQIRIETMHYFLKHYSQNLKKQGSLPSQSPKQDNDYLSAVGS